MITSSDIEYKKTKSIKLGLTKLAEPFISLANWMQEKYGVRPLNFYFDVISHSKLPRLQVIFERRKDYSTFCENYLPTTNSDVENEVASVFRELVKKYPQYSARKIYILFETFETVAKEEANSSISNEKIDELITRLNLPDLWQVARGFWSAIFFFYTDKQVEEHQTDGMEQLLKDAYFELIKECDEFDYITKDSIDIGMDSKENFDNVYQSNWYFYWK